MRSRLDHMIGACVTTLGGDDSCVDSSRVHITSTTTENVFHSFSHTQYLLPLNRKKDRESDREHTWHSNGCRIQAFQLARTTPASTCRAHAGHTGAHREQWRNGNSTYIPCMRSNTVANGAGSQSCSRSTRYPPGRNTRKIYHDAEGEG